MRKYRLLDDEPALIGSDSLFFSRYLSVIETRVLNRTEQSPFVIGIYGSWGSGKTTIMRMLVEKLKQDEYRDRWEVIEFSPWMYRNEKSLLLPLLATMAKKQPAFQRLIQSVVDSGPSLIKAISSVNPVAKAGLPLVNFLDELRKNKENAKDFGEKIADAVKSVTGSTKRMVFFIDDLDRCHDHKQIIGLLEQIKLFLHLPKCVFFIGADRDQIVKAIERQFQGEGANYLDKFIQLPFELSPHHGHHLMDMVGLEDGDLRRYLMLVSEVLNHNPRKLKKLWNQAVVGLEVVKQEISRVSRIHDAPTIERILKWLLLSECAPLKTNPYLYLKYEIAAKAGRKIDMAQLNRELGLKEQDGKWRSDFHSRLSIFICQNLQRHRYDTPSRLSLYAKASGEDISRSRTLVESAVFGGKIHFNNEDFSDADLSYGAFNGVSFHHCVFKNALLRGADIRGVSFIGCDLDGTCFDTAEIEGTTFTNCTAIDNLNTEPTLYEIIADSIVESCTKSVEQTCGEEMFKMYRTIIELHKEAGTLTSTLENQLREKGKKVRDAVDG